jgi:hypothetical protein
MNAARLGALLVVVGMGLTSLGGAPLILAGLVLLARTFRDANFGILLVGPIPRAELTQRARHNKVWIWRCVYVLAALAIVLLNFAAYQRDIDLGQGLGRRNLARMNESITGWLGIMLIGGVTILSLQLAAGAIADERAEHRWDILRTTDLRPQEILLGLLAARLPLMLDPLLAAMPVLAILPYLGGVSPMMIVALVMICVSLAVAIGMVTIFHSLYARKAGDAVGMTFGVAAAYGFLTSFLAPNFYYIWQWDYLWFLGWGNPVLLGIEFRASTRPGEAAIFELAWHFSTAMMAFFFIYFLLGVRRLPTAEMLPKRSVALQEQIQRSNRNVVNLVRWLLGRKTVDTALPATATVKRPPVTDEPVLWWERYGWLGVQQAWLVNTLTPRLMRNVFLITLVLSLLTGPMDAALDSICNSEIYESICLTFSNRVLMPIPCVWWLMIAAGTTAAIAGAMAFFAYLVRGAKCIVKERAAGTLEPLALTDLEPEEILKQKCKGVLLSDWPLFQLALALSLPLVLTGHVPVLMALVTVQTIVMVAVSHTVLGVWISSRAKKPGRAIGVSVALMYFLMYPACGCAAGLVAAYEKEKWAAVLIVEVIVVLMFAAIVGGLYHWALHRFKSTPMGKR